MGASDSKPLIFGVISVLVVMLIYSSTSAFWASARPVGELGCEIVGTLKAKCCQQHRINEQPGFPGSGTIVNYCTDCDIGPGGPPNYINCSERYIEEGAPPGKADEGIVAPLEEGVLEQPPTPPPFDPAAPLKGGVLEQLEQGGGAAPGFSPGFLQRQEQLPPAEQGAAELPVVCSEEAGLELDEETGQCVPIESPVTEEPEEAPEEEPEEEQSEPEEEQPSEEESDSGDESNN